jgi:LexA-binding, inner membrane-associated putative hydrolase
MFIGHFALGFAAKRAAPRVSLAVLGSATQIADLLWPVFLAVGIEQVRIDPGNTAVTPLDFVSYPYSHSLAMLIVWGLMFAAVFRPKVRLKADPTYGKEVDLYVGSGFSRTYTVLVLLVVSHWFLDWITHRPDMPLYPGGPKFGLGLWNSVAATVAIETAMYVAGLWIYIRSTRARDGIGRWGFWALAAFLPVVYVANILGPPPPTVSALWMSAVAGGAILVVWLWWVDRHRDGILPPRRVR